MARMEAGVAPNPPPRSATLPLFNIQGDLGGQTESEAKNVTSAPEIGTHSGGWGGNPQLSYAPMCPHPPPMEDPPEPPQACFDSSEEEEEERTNLISIQSSRAPVNDDILMTQLDTEESSGGDTPFDSPAHVSTLIRQQASLQGHEDDIMMMRGFPAEDADPDYMNQDAIDDIDEEMSSGSESENRHIGSPPKRIIVSQKSDLDDKIIGMSGMNPDPDYMNQETIDELDVQADAKDADYMNQDVIDQGVEEADEAIEYMNQAIIDVVHSEIERDQVQGVAPSDATQGIINTALVTQVPVNDNDFYDTEDDLTDDFEDDDEWIDRPKASTHRELLQIRGTATRSRPPDFGDSKQDYENQDVVQDVLEGEIIPMVVAPTGHHSLPYPLNQRSSVMTTCLPVADWNEGTIGSSLSYLEPKTQAEVSSNGQLVSHDSWKESDGGRASWCSDNVQQESSLDFVCDRPSISSKKGVGTSQGGHRLIANSSPNLLVKNSPILATKPRSHTDANPLKPKPHPLSFTTQANSNTSSELQASSLEMDGFSKDPFDRDYIPVS